MKKRPYPQTLEDLEALSREHGFIYFFDNYSDHPDHQIEFDFLPDLKSSDCEEIRPDDGVPEN